MNREELELTGPDGFPIRVLLRSPESPAGSVVLCHGFKGFMSWGFFPLLAERLTDAGLRVISFDFSGSGMTAHGRFADQESFARNTFSRELRDLRTVLADARRREWIGSGYGLFGHSRGGGVSVLQAGDDASVRALVTWAAISTVRRWSRAEMDEWRERGYLESRNARTGEALRQGTEMLEEVEREAHRSLDVLSAASRIRAPWLIVHGTQDDTVHVDEGHRLREAATTDDVRLELLETNHTFGASHPLRERPLHLERAVGLTVDFFASHVR